ncbi:pentatricopeptide repeat-containing protein At1g20230 [Dioscorea cayenensis subsp. rotundata]|uniref:Pentatricopeptide repeat-containing protein At1g20230 n=1 Tax=Dioscorea cayennensis subsp. rotundata TaxID=55577 RepID=A0AB40CIR0_DIOCR|nr:pentatricopeptide repeat-containing protein At1g20230 [Dioscorea cayenensis subsp. rotundata]
MSLLPTPSTTITTTLAYTLLRHPFPTLLETQQSHAHLLKTGLLVLSLHTSTKLLSLYSSSFHLFSDAISLLSSLPSPDSFSFSTLISSLSHSQLFSSSLLLFRRMLSSGLPPDPFVLPTAVKASSSLSSLPLGRQLHALSISSGHSSHPFVHSSLIHMYLTCNRIPDARLLFDAMPHRNLVSWSSMISGYAKLGRVHDARHMFDQMRHSGLEPNSITWNGMITGFNHSSCFLDSLFVFSDMHSQGFGPDGTSFSSVLSAAGDVENVCFGKQIHCYVIKAGFVIDECVVSAMIDMYGKCGYAKEMVQVLDEFDGMDVASCNAVVAGLSRNGLVEDALREFRRFEGMGIKLNVVSWTSIIACCSQNGKDMEALELFREMQMAGVEANSVTIPCLLPACANIAALMHGKSAHCFTLRRAISEDVYVASALVDMYAKCGRINNARSIFDVMPSRNLVSWNTMLGGYSMHGKAKDAMELFHLMQRSGQKPDFISFTCVLAACSQAGLVEMGWYYFNKMSREHGIGARMEHYACMVSLLGRAGKLEEAYELIKEMAFEPDACVWGALLSSSRVHGNVMLGEIAAEKLFELEPGNAGNYVLLSNIYANKGIWDEVDRVRDTMKGMGLKKNPGCSWIEIKNKVHMLLAGDKTHPQLSKILEKLEQLSAEMKKLGCNPSTDFVLHNVEEQDKEQMLCGHSEKLAMALGLINTSPRTPLRVIKNLRICGDCHAVMKFVSKFEGRELFVRDTNRFHHFRDGECSCRDYW